MPLDPVVRDRLITWGVQLILAVIVALAARYGITVPQPPVVVTVVTPADGSPPAATTHRGP